MPDFAWKNTLNLSQWIGIYDLGKIIDQLFEMKLRCQYGLFKHFNKLSFGIETGKFGNILIDLDFLEHINNTINTKQILFGLILNPQLRILTALLKIDNKRFKKHLQHCINLRRLPQLRLLFERQHY